MELNEVRSRKQKLESDILVLINEFQKETEVSITEINLVTQKINTEQIVVRLKVEIEL